MLFGNLDEQINEAVKNNRPMFVNGQQKKQNVFSKLLTTLSKYGMNYDDDVLKNMQAIPADKSLLSKTDQLDNQNLFSQLGKWKQKDNEDKNFFEKDLESKLQILRKIAMQPELEDILDVMSNECIVYDDEESYICNPFIDTAILQTLNEESAEEIRNAIDTIFYKIYYLVDWNNNAWNDFKRFLIEGILAYEIVYDDIKHPKNIIGLVPIDPITLTKKVEEGVTYWYQFKDIQGKERILLDSQVVYIKYQDSGCALRQSYLERLIRPFNIYRIIEQAQIIWTVTQSSFKTIFTIPIAGMNRAKGTQTLNTAMNRYKEDISFNLESGELSINGKMNMPFNKEYWFPEGSNGTPSLETLVDGGPQLNDNEQLKYFKNELYKVSKIPTNRFDNENQSTWFGSDATQQMRDEINFARYIARLRHVFALVMLKPLRIQLSLQIPDIKNDKRILDAIQLRFNTYNPFDEMMDIEINNKRIEYLTNLRDSMTITDAEGNETSYFANKFLLVKILKMSDADLELNEKYKLLEEKPEDENPEDAEGTEDELDGFGSEDSGDTESEDKGGSGEGPELDAAGGDIDQEMLGNVQPESSETTEA